MRLIDADTIFPNGCVTVWEWDGEMTADGILKAIKDAPTVVAEPVRHGEWVGTDYDGYADGNPVYYLWQCSCCHEEYERDGLPPWYDYCPNCGAKMDGGKQDA